MRYRDWLWLFSAAVACAGQALPAPTLETSPLPPVYCPDKGDGTFRNPIVFADYSDPDVCRVGDDYYMTASSFANFPGLPILHSRDLVNWTIVGHALVRYPAPLDANFDAPAHGKGVWAPSIRYHNGQFYVYFGDPDLGIFMTHTADPAGTWAALTCVKDAKGWIDCCPLWDDDGKAYLVHAFARSRAGINNCLDICRMAPDGTRLLDEGTRVFDGGTDTGAAARAGYTTVEGPKLYKRNGFYYIFAPGGGVTAGYQIVFRAKSILGPYESRIVLDKGMTTINGPHQGGWVETATVAGRREDWFVHFQEVLPYGRILHLQPVQWVGDWPVMGEAGAGAEKGQPVMMHKMPLTGNPKAENRNSKVPVPQTSDEFDLPALGLQWQWWGNFKPEWYSLTARPGFLRLIPVPLGEPTLLYNRPNLLTQKFPAEVFTATAKLDPAGLAEGETAGLVLAGKTMAALACSRGGQGVTLVRTNYNANDGRATADAVGATAVLGDVAAVYLRMHVAARGVCVFSYSTDEATFTELGTAVTAINAQWIGAKVGLFANGATDKRSKGYADFEYFHSER
jgi:beta-xylosidase